MTSFVQKILVDLADRPEFVMFHVIMYIAMA